MKTESIIIAHPKTDDQVNAIKASKESPYNSDFVVKLEKSKKDFENGDFTRVEKKDLQVFLGIE